MEHSHWLMQFFSVNSYFIHWVEFLAILSNILIFLCSEYFSRSRTLTKPLFSRTYIRTLDFGTNNNRLYSELELNQQHPSFIVSFIYLVNLLFLISLFNNGFIYLIIKLRVRSIHMFLTSWQIQLYRFPDKQIYTLEVISNLQ